MSQDILTAVNEMGGAFDGAPIVNMTGIDSSEIESAIPNQEMTKLRKALQSWSENVYAGTNNRGTSSLWQRDRYVTPGNVFEQMELAYTASEMDDVVGGVIDTTESLAFSKVSFYADDPDEEDIYNQVAANMNLDARLREMWRELFIVSQFYCAIWWKTEEFTVRGRSLLGTKRKKKVKLRVPDEITLLDPLKVVPVGNFMFGQEQLVYIADGAEAEAIRDHLNGKAPDSILERIITEEYEPSPADQAMIKDLGVKVGLRSSMFKLNPKNVFRHTATRPGFKPFSPVRMKSVFPLLDMKEQLRQMDRAHLIGGTNFIVLITIGTDDHRAKQSEVDNLKSQVQLVARTPVLVGDHRLNVEIVTPKTDNTLKPERYNGIDARITGRLYNMFVLGNYSAGASGDDSVKLMKVIARGMESRRHMLARSLNEHIFGPMFEGSDLKTPPKLKYMPKNIALDFDDGYAAMLFDMRQNRMISRETMLSQMDFDQDDEARMIQRESKLFDEIFQEQVPYSKDPNSAPSDSDGDQADEEFTETDKRSAGRRKGGNRKGGGSAPGTGQGQEKDQRRGGRSRKAA